MKALVLIILLAAGSHAFAQDYVANRIPDELKTRASAVIRLSETNIEVKSLDMTVYKVKHAVTVLNKNGDSDAGLHLYYNKSRQIRSVKGTIYNEFGMPAAKFTEKQFRDESVADGFSLFNDDRVKRYQPAQTAYPYTIEYEYEVRWKQTLLFRDWMPINSSGVSLENASLVFTCSPDFEIRYKELNFPGTAEISSNKDGNKTYTWKLSALKAYRDEPYSPYPETYLPSVKFAPAKFKYMGISGSFSNWDEYGRWVYEKLLKGRDAVSETTAYQINELVKDIADPRLKAKKIYEYVQQKTRYISVQIGIGGFQPITAAEVDRVGYGDCKGLVNYTQGLLKLADIDSYYAVVEAGSAKRSAIPDFSSMDQFNHVILCIPFKTDTVWADCTSKTLPFGYLSDFTDDRLAIACTPEGGKLLKTPAMKTEQNKQLRNGRFTVHANGSISGEIETSFEGWQYNNREMLVNETQTEQFKKLREIYSLNNLDIQSFQLDQNKTENPLTLETLKFKAEGYVSTSGERLFLVLNAVNRGRQLREVRNRINPVYISRGYIDVDELVYELPENYRIETKPEGIKIEKPFGSFEVSAEVKDNTIIYSRKIMLKEGTYPAESYEELVNFYQKVYTADEAKAVLVKKSSGL